MKATNEWIFVMRNHFRIVTFEAWDFQVSFASPASTLSKRESKSSTTSFFTCHSQGIRQHSMQSMPYLRKPGFEFDLCLLPAPLSNCRIRSE